MGRPARNAIRLDALKRAFFENAARRDEEGAARRAVTIEAIAAASGLDIRRAPVEPRPTATAAEERTQGRS